MKLYFVTFLSLVLTTYSLGQTKWEVVDFGEFTVELPEGYSDEQLPSHDSYASKVIADSTEFMFDYGYYSPKMTLSLAEYLEDEEWKMSPELSILIYENERPILLKLDTVSKFEYVAYFDVSTWINNDSSLINKHPDIFQGKCKIDSNIMSITILVPEKIQRTNFYITESDSTFKRIFIPFEGENRKSGTYLIDFSNCKQRSWCSKQLSFWVEKRGNLTDEEVLRVYRSLKFKT